MAPLTHSIGNMDKEKKNILKQVESSKFLEVLLLDVLYRPNGELKAFLHFRAC